MNEDIITSLQNAVERGSTLEQAKRTAINSGYDAREVEEAAHTVGNLSSSLQPLSDEHLTMPEHKKKWYQFPGKKQPAQTPVQKNESMQTHIKQEIRTQNPSHSPPAQGSTPTPLPREQSIPSPHPINNTEGHLPTKQKKRRPIKEIILIGILLICIIILGATLYFRDAILAILS